MRGLATWTAAILAMLGVVVSVAVAKPPAVICPIQDGTPTGGDVQWAFTDSGRPDGRAIKSSYVHGQGNWTSGRAHGTGCTTDTPRKAGARNLVLGVSGPSKLTGRVKQGGLLGVRIVLPIKVRASDDKTCKRNATGTITLFASYYAAPHVDTMRVRFGPNCASHDLSYSGSTLHVYIARDGAQVNTP